MDNCAIFGQIEGSQDLSVVGGIFRNLNASFCFVTMYLLTYSYVGRTVNLSNETYAPFSL